MDMRLLETIDNMCCFDELYECEDYILAVQETCSDCIGFDFTILSSKDGSEVDGGVYEDYYLDKEAFLSYVAEDFLDCHREDLTPVAFSLSELDC